MPDTIYTPEAPVIAADGKITVDALLRDPLRLQKRVMNMVNQRLIAGYIFADGAPAVGGAVIFERTLAAEGELYTSRDVQEIEPMAEFPLLDDADSTPEVRAASKYGGAFEVSYEQKRRNRVDIVNRKLTRLANTIVRKVDLVALAELNKDQVITANALVGTSWSNATTGNPTMDIATAASRIDNRDLGYTANTVLINPAQELALFGRKDIRDALPRENATTNPFMSGKVNGLMGYTWVVSNRVPAGTAYVLEAKMPGSLHDEVPFYTRVTDQPRNESWLLQGARVTVPVITEPLSVTKLTGIA
ncbi:major capsid protein [uncultured Arsenicicoccus sp.]|uniref:major capsid protein n=1 Tax=uncultured Arsenicicoccus sp. TaxID=491339 RepID=UPI002599F0AC|nr:major capsid protein [uncultured Arsenicicoccus sp.]